MNDVVSLLEPVAEIIQAVSAEIIDPRFRSLTADQVIEKSPGDLVTVADREAEAALAAGFAELLPGVPVVGEEAVSADGSVLELLQGDGPAWVVDPIDGTKNFVNGSVDHAVMVALVDGDETVGSWIWYPASEVMLTASRGGGVARNGVPVAPIARPANAAELGGVVKTGFAPDVIRAAMKKRREGFRSVSRGRGCAGVEYRDIVDGRQDFLLYWLANPWDHLPGALFITELGGRAAHLDGTPYTPSSRQAGLLVAAGETDWAVIRGQLFG